MNNLTAYERLLTLPLFQGMNQEKLTLLLEKCPFEFSTYQDGETIIEMGEVCSKFYFVYLGRVVSTLTNNEGSLTIVEELSAPNIISPIYLYGRNRNQPSRICAKGEAHILTVPRESLTKMVQLEPIVLLNLLNIITTRSQLAFTNLLSLPEGNCSSKLAFWLLNLTHKGGEHIQVRCKTATLARLLGSTIPTMEATLKEWEQLKYISSLTGTSFKMTDRRAVDQLFQNNE